MDYKSKYLKYKEKYFRLRTKQIQFGGTVSKIPPTLPRTYSYLFMPLLYYALDNSSVRLPEGFEQAFLDCVDNLRDFGTDILFTTLQQLITYIRDIIMANGVSSIEQLKLLNDKRDSYHFAGDLQESLINYNSDPIINAIISCLGQMLINRCVGQEFVYLK